MIDNIELIKPLLNFENSDDFYMLYIFKRKKDQENPENSQSVRTIKSYCINSIESLEYKYEEIKQLSEIFKARVYIHIQKQNHYEIGLNMIIELGNRLKNKVYNQKNLFESVVGQLKVLEKRWIIDLDFKDEFHINTHIKCINNDCEPIGEKVITIIPTKQGVHLITKPFNTETYRNLISYNNSDIQKKNPTLLYYPNSLEK